MQPRSFYPPFIQGKHVEEFVFRVHKADGGLEKLKLSGTPADRGILAFYCSPVSSINKLEGNLVHGYYRGGTYWSK